jgi:hypothetical protein
MRVPVGNGVLMGAPSIAPIISFETGFLSPGMLSLHHLFSVEVFAGGLFVLGVEAGFGEETGTLMF